MEYIEIDYNYLKRNGKSLKNAYQEPNNPDLMPILFQGEVYKFFNLGIKKKERLLLKLAELNLKTLVRVNKLLTSNGKTSGYSYDFDSSILLKEALAMPLDLDTRLKYIDAILRTDEELLKNGLTYFDYHSANILAGNSIKFIDIDSIIPATTLNRENIKGFLLDLIISIYMNNDITFNSDNSVLTNLFAEFFNNQDILFMYDLDLRKIFDEMVRKTPEDSLNLKSEVNSLLM